MKTKLLLISLLCIGLLSCETDNKRDNESSNEKENTNGKDNEKQEGAEQGFDYENVKYPQGAIKGVFSVSDTKKVAFSQGNLQYQANTNTWRFAEHQYDYIGEDNENISSTYSGWIDLFGWGTGDYPIYVSGNYYRSNWTFVDWGVNKISNAGNQVSLMNLWPTLTKDEWSYLLNSRLNASAKQGVAYVNGINGLVLLPDDWTLPSGTHFTSGYADDFGSQYYQTVNTYTISEWQIMESAGAVFLPAAGYRIGTSVDDVGTRGKYWSSSHRDDYAYSVSFGSRGFNSSNLSDRRYGYSVRLCSQIFSK